MNTRNRWTLAIILFVAVAVAGVYYYLQNYTESTKNNEYEAASVITQVSARMADKVVDSMGVNGVLINDTTTWDTIMKPRIKELGIRHTRDSFGSMGAGEDAFSLRVSRMNELSNPTDGSDPIGFLPSIGRDPVSTSYPTNDCFMIKVKILIQGGNTAKCGSVQNQTISAKVKIDGIEGSNEPDHCPSHDVLCQLDNKTWYERAVARTPDWVPVTFNGIKLMSEKLNADPVTQSIPVLAHSPVWLGYYDRAPVSDWDEVQKKFVNLKDASGATIYRDIPTEVGQLQQVNQYIDAGNTHKYCGNKAMSVCLPSWLTSVKSYFTNKPIVMTEFGWSTTSGYVTQAVQAKYIPRGFLTNFDSGVTRSYIYNFRNRTDIPTAVEQNFGIINGDGTPKPAFTAIKNMIKLLRDPGPTFTTESLNYAVATDVATIKNVLLQKRDKSFWLALYNDIATSSDADVTTPVSLILDQAADITVYSLNSAMTPIQTLAAVKSAPINVPDKVILVKIVPLPPAQDPTPIPDPTPTPELTHHIGDIDGTTAKVGSSKWKAEITFTVHDENEKPVADALVSTTWIGTSTSSFTCRTTSAGRCTVTTTTKASSITVTVTKIVKTGWVYKSINNHDPDGSSTGTRITLTKP